MYKSLLVAAAVLISTFSVVSATAQVSALPTQSQNDYTPFVKKRYSINGGWKIERKGTSTVITFDDNFKTKGGPDLKVFLSPKTLNDVSDSTVVNGAIKLGVLKSNRGQQSYIIPEDVDLSQFESVLIHCEAFSVLWGGFDL